MQGLDELAIATQNIEVNNKATWIPLYYSIREDKVYSEEGSGRFFITYLITPQTESDIAEAVRFGMSM